MDVSADLWWQGPEWLTKPDCWPPDIATCPTPKTIKEVLAVAVAEEDILNVILESHPNRFVDRAVPVQLQN